MNPEVKAYIEKYPDAIIEQYQHIRGLLFQSFSGDIEETLWARLPSYYVGEKYVRLIPFKDHINIEAKAVTNHREELSGYKITPKGMLQIFGNQSVPEEILMQIFRETLE